MNTKMQLTAKLSQSLSINQQLCQAISLLQYNTLELKQYVQQILEKNVLLELDETQDDLQNDESDSEIYTAFSSNKKSTTSYNFEDENTLENFSLPESLREHLLFQTLLCRFNESEQIIAEAIIDAIDEKGYLTMSFPEIHKTLQTDIQFSADLFEKILKMIQTFDPTGVGARDSRECLLLQLNSFSEENSSSFLAKKIIQDNMELVSTRNVKKILKQLNISQEEYVDAMNLITSLDPAPGLRFSKEREMNIEPELYVKKKKGVWEVNLVNSVLTNVKINNYYKELIKNNKKHSSYSNLKQELDEAKFLINSLKRRNDTLLLVAIHIVNYQSDFFDQGPVAMKPMNIADLASSLSLHESTISRVTTGKFIATPRGVFELKYFFSGHLKTQSGIECSAVTVKTLLKEFIKQETNNNVLSDAEITEKMKEKGINIARRTVAKYREAMKILPSYQRQGKNSL